MRLLLVRFTLMMVHVFYLRLRLRPCQLRRDLDELRVFHGPRLRDLGDPVWELCSSSTRPALLVAGGGDVHAATVTRDHGRMPPTSQACTAPPTQGEDHAKQKDGNNELDDLATRK